MRPGTTSNPGAGDAPVRHRGRPGAERDGGDAVGDDGAPRLPGLATWGGVYWFVFAVFVFVVAGLAAFTHLFA